MGALIVSKEYVGAPPSPRVCVISREGQRSSFSHPRAPGLVVEVADGSIEMKKRKSYLFQTAS